MLTTEVLIAESRKRKRRPPSGRARAAGWAECTKKTRVAPGRAASLRGSANGDSVPSRSSGLASERQKTEQFDPQVSHRRVGGESAASGSADQPADQ
jgi:hypothetical protein